MPSQGISKETESATKKKTQTHNPKPNTQTKTPQQQQKNQPPKTNKPTHQTKQFLLRLITGQVKISTGIHTAL